MKIFAPLFLVALLAGCASTPTTYLRLAPVAGPTIGGAGPAVAVAHIATPPAIDRLYLTSLTGPTTLHVANHARWVAPLGGMMQGVLARDLAARLPDTEVPLPGDPAPHGGARVVSVTVATFLPEPGRVVLDADWRVTSRRHHRIVADGRAHIVVPAGATPALQAQAMSEAIGRLADRIAARVD